MEYRQRNKAKDNLTHGERERFEGSSMEYRQKNKAKDSIVYGVRPVEEAIRSGKTIEKLMVLRSFSSEQISRLLSLAKSRAIPVQYLPIEAFKRQFSSENHQGVAAIISQIEYVDLEESLCKIEEEGRNPLVLVLDRVTDVRNFGAMLRTAEAAAVDLVVFPSHNSAAINSDAVKTSAGAIFSINLSRVSNLKTALNLLKAHNINLVAVSEKAASNYCDISYKEATAFLLGSEEDGISPELLKMCKDRACIPMKGKISSLNVSVACGILLYEALRQRG